MPRVGRPPQTQLSSVFTCATCLTAAYADGEHREQCTALRGVPIFDDGTNISSLKLEQAVRPTRAGLDTAAARGRRVFALPERPAAVGMRCCESLQQLGLGFRPGSVRKRRVDAIARHPPRGARVWEGGWPWGGVEAGSSAAVAQRASGKVALRAAGKVALRAAAHPRQKFQWRAARPPARTYRLVSSPVLSLK